MTTRFTVKNEADFIPLASVMLGFHPTHSLVMLTIGSFTARVDLPSEEDVEECVGVLLEPAVRHQVKQVAFVIYDGDDNMNLKDQLINSFITAGIDVVALVQFDQGRYRSHKSVDWQSFDIASHPFTLEAAYQDRPVRHSTREEMAEHIKPRAEMWETATAEAIALMQVNGLEETVKSLTRAGARESVELWTKALRGCDEGSKFASECAVVLGFSAWLMGDGAMAWVCHDLIEPCAFKDVLGSVLERAISPDTWPE